MKRLIILLCWAMAISCACEKQKDPDPEPVKPNPDTVVVKSQVDCYMTSANKSLLFTKVAQNFNVKPNMSPYTVTITGNEKYQAMQGFGAAVTGSSCYNLLKMSATDRDVLLKEIFDPEEGMGYSYIRISIGCSDFSMDEFTCCDTPGIENFAIHTLDQRDLVPILKEILAINPKIKIMASPWTAPRWMKVNNLTDLKAKNSWTSGQLNPKYYGDYATYFVKYIQAMKALGIPIESITIQNEPLNHGNSASMYMGWEEQLIFIKGFLGPAFKAAGLTTKIYTFDHNYNYDNIASQQGYPLNIYADEEAYSYVHGSAWHAYGGSVTELDRIHSAYPDKGIIFTEISIGTWSASSREECFRTDLMWNMREVCLGTINRYGEGVIMWNLMLDDKRGPNRPGGCTTCYGCIDINQSDYKTLTRNSHYYTMAHLSKVIKPNAHRVKTSGYTVDGLHYAAFINPDGTYAIVAQNDTNSEISVTFDNSLHSFSCKIPSKTIASYRWAD